MFNKSKPIISFLIILIIVFLTGCSPVNTITGKYQVWEETPTEHCPDCMTMRYYFRVESCTVAFICSYKNLQVTNTEWYEYNIGDTYK